MDISTENCLWCKLDKKFFHFDEDLYVCSVYIPPEFSSREKRLKKDHFNSLIDMISKIKSNNIILMGDFNARTKNYEDLLNKDNNSDNTMPDNLFSQIKRMRNNQDKKGNKYGRKLTDLCLASKLYIANGRTLGDLQGSFTCYENNGVSTVDYSIISEKLFPLISKFIVSDPVMGSDHCVLELFLSLPKETTYKGIEMNIHPPKIRWNEKNKDMFLKYLQLPSTEIRLKEIEVLLDKKSECKVEEAIKEINYIYTHITLVK